MIKESKKRGAVCAECGKEFSFYLSIQPGICCSRLCSNKSPLRAKKIANTHKTYGEKHWSRRPEVKAKLVKTLRSDNWLGKQRPDMRGEKHWFWRGGHTNERQLAMQRTEYKTWRREVFSRDNHTCQMCGKRGGDLEADHIRSWRDHSQLRYEVSNGRTLCVPCHRSTENWGRKGIPLRVRELST